MIHGEEGDSYTAEHQHAARQELGFTECVMQVPGQESHNEADQGQGAKASQDTIEGSNGALVAQDDDVAMLRMCICVNVRWIFPHPDATE